MLREQHEVVVDALLQAGAHSRGRLTTKGDVLRFITAGNATFTVRSRKTQTRFTYRMRAVPDKPGAFFVAAMRGQDNENDYSYIGMAYPKIFVATKKSNMNLRRAFDAFSWIWLALHTDAFDLLEQMDVWHEGKCGRCGRKLTVPESIERGIGPECAGRML